MKQIIAIYARNTVFANILMLVVILAGIAAAGRMIREFFPEFALDMITVTIAYPGANPEEIEEGISRKVESAIEAVEGVKEYTTSSSENVSVTVIQVLEGYDVTRVLDRVRNKINGISTFPVDAEKPVITDLTTQESVMILGLSGEMSEQRLKEWAAAMKDEMVALPEISNVNIFGVRDYEISIEVSEETLRSYGLTFTQLVTAIRRENMNLAGGTIRTRGEEIRIRTVGRRYTGDELKNMVILARPSGEIITLDKLAVIRDSFTETPIMATINGERAALVSVVKTSKDDTLVMTSAMHRFIDHQRTLLPQGARITIIYETSDMLRARINLLLKNGVIGLLLVFLILWMFLDLRLSFWSGMGIPISLAGGFVILWWAGGTINMISLFGFLMVLGIVVDDAIVVGESIFYHRTQGKPPIQAVVDGISEVGMPVVAAVTTTIAAFLPLSFVGGIMGKFIAILPVVVIACLSVSLLECLFLLPVHLNHLPDPKQVSRRSNGLAHWIASFHNLTAKGLLWLVRKTYVPFLKKALYWRYIALSVAVSILLISIGLFRAGIIKFEVFPEVDGFIMTANIKFPAGTPIDITEKAVRQVEDALLHLAAKSRTKTGEPLLKERLVMVGQAVGGNDSGSHLGGIIVTMLDSEKRGIHSKDLRIAWEKETGAIPGIENLTFSGMGGGPQGAPIEIWVQGHDLDQILAAANDLIVRLQKFEGLFQIRSDFSPGKTEIRLTLKPEAHTLGLTVSDLAGQVFSGYYGDDAVRLQRGRDDIRIKVRYTEDERKRLSDFKRIRIRTPQGFEVPILAVADISFAPGFSTITRTNGMRRVMVSSEVDTNRANANEVVAELMRSYIPKLSSRYPELRFSFQGEKKSIKESFSSLYIGYPLAMVGIFFIIATMFRSYVQPLLISLTIPFGIIGAILGHLVLGYQFTMMSIFGVVALAGVVVNDAIVLIERVNENLAEGMPFQEAVISGGARRFRAIFLTTVSTVGGLAPLILETDFQAKFLIPMAISIAAGVGFATVLTLVLLPSLFMILNDIRRGIYWIRHKVMPSREAVEPAAARRASDME